jgi:hypothetical protein
MPAQWVHGTCGIVADMGRDSWGVGVGFGVLVLLAGVVAALSQGSRSPAEQPKDVAVPAGERSGLDITACEDMPSLWSGAHEINYDADARTVTFVWGNGRMATLRDTDPGCDSQPRLEDQLRGSRDGYLANEKVACQELRNLVDAVKEEPKAQGKSIIGRIPVSDAAAENAARKNPKTAWLADSGKLREKNHARGPRAIDLDSAEQVLANCPK